FPIMPRLFMGLRMEDRHPITEILRITPPIPESCQWAMFLRNHDELTLEMVTDEERDYMYRTYAQDRGMRINLGIRRRLAPLLENDRRRIELMNALLLSLPGTPVLYYGDEIGMGDNIYLGDRNGVRTPMQWSPDRNAGFSRANPQKLYLPVNIDPEYHYEALNVETQNNNSHSLLWWMKRMIAQRKQHPAFGRGKMEILFPGNRKILAFVREFEDEKILVVANLSRFTQCVELDLSRHRESVPVEVFGRNSFPAITEQPYLLSLGPHAFQWFHLQPREHSQESLSVTARAEDIPVLEADEQEVFSTTTRNAIAKLLPPILRRRSWFAKKHRTIRYVRIHDVIALPETTAHILLVNLEYTDGEPEMFTIPLSLATGEQAETVLRERLHTVLAKVKGLPDPQSILYGSVSDRQFNDALLKAMLRRRRIKGEKGDIVGTHTRAFREAWGRVRSNLEPQPQTLDAHKILVTLGQDFVFTLYREVEAGPNPDREIGEFLTNHTNFSHIPRTLGAVEYRVTQDETEQVTTLGTLSAYLRNAADGWLYTLDHLGLFFERALAIGEDDPRLKELNSGTPFALSSQPVPRVINELLGGHVETALLLGRCTAELHSALSSHPEIPDFAPEPFTEFYRHGLYHGLLAHMNKSLDALRQNVEKLSGAAQEEARTVLEQQDTLRERFSALRDMRISGMRTRHHGDYHLANVLYTGSDFIIKNFDGDYNGP
ncbi:MAG TPA: alpha-glucosidase C-terminal domain-containing protein, partial [Candidatus Angelobacter sp.]